MVRIVAYRGRGQKNWRWRLVASNGKIVADSAEGYATKASLTKAVRRIQRGLNGAEFIEVLWV